MDEDYQLLAETQDGYYTVIMGNEYRPASPEPASSPCPNLHTVTGLGQREGWQNRPSQEVVVRSVHHCTLLNAAVIMGNTSLIKQLLDKGDITIDSLHQYDCSGSPVLCEAAYHNRIEAMRLLLDYGANVDTVNHLGLTPAHISAGNAMDRTDMISLLIKYKADINKRSKDGSSPIHIAAEKGNFRIVKTLLESNQLKEKILMETYHHGNAYLPPPIILATANHHYLVVNVMKKAANYSPSIISNVDLVSWARSVLSKYFWQKGQLILQNLFGELDQALQGRHKELAQEFGKDIYDSQELEAKQSTDSLAIVHQSLLLLECIVGPSSKLHIHWMERTITSLMRKNVAQYEVAEMMLRKILQIMPRTEKEMLGLGVYMMPSHLHVYLSMFMSRSFWETVCTLTVAHHSIDYIPLLDQFMNIVDTILELKAHQSCQELDHWGESFQNTFCQLLSLYACGLHSSNQPSSPTDRKTLNMIGFVLIDKYRDHMRQYFTSILHFTLRKVQQIVDILKRSGIGGRNAVNSYIQLVEVLLLMGCSNVAIINTPYRQFFCRGERPLHMAVRMAEMDPCYLPLVNLMFIHGAHYDGVSLNGVVPGDIPTRSSLEACFDLKPLPLACIVSKVIVTCKIEYWNSTCIPRGVKRFINYHDTEEREEL